jgi:hypothetical protein
MPVCGTGEELLMALCSRKNNKTGRAGHVDADPLTVQASASRDGHSLGHPRLLVRRNRTTGELAYDRCHSTPASPATVVKVAGSGRRWRTFQSEKGLAGVDEHQVRRCPSWARGVILSMPAHAFLAVVRADAPAHRPTPGDVIPPTCNEIQRLFMGMIRR